MAISFGGHLLRAYGAYIKTDISGLLDISGNATGIIGMIGLAEKGPVNEPVTVTSYVQLVNIFGDGPLVRHALAAYVGGASTVVCVRTGDPQGASLTAITVSGATTPLAYTWAARELGTLGDNISVSVDDSGNSYIIRVRYIDERGNDVRETFTTPRYVPNPVYTAGGQTFNRYYAGNTDDYFVLLNTDNNTVREVPTSWDHGNADVEAFVEKVNDLKSTTEVLVGPFPYGSGTNDYPLALVASVVNHGGFDQAPSQLVELKDVDPSIEDLLAPGYTYDPNTADSLVAHPFVQMSGGNNGDDGTNYYGIVDDITGGVDYNMTFETAGVLNNAWVPALEVMEGEDINFIQPAYLFNYKRNTSPGLPTTNSDTFQWDQRYKFFSALMPLFISHINTMSNIPNRKYRTMVVGTPYYRKGTTANGTAQDFLDSIVDISGLINSDRIQLWVGGFRSSAFSANVEEYGADMLASFAVGAHAAREVSVSLTFAQLAGIFTHGLEFNFSQNQIDELYTRSHAFVLKRRTAAGAMEYVAAHNLTSFTGASNRGFPLFITRRIVDSVATFVVRNLEENFVGRKSKGAETAGRVADFVSALLRRKQLDEEIVAFANVRAEVDEYDKTLIRVYYDIQPTSEVTMLLNTQTITYSLA